MNLYALILAGGSGTRFWPESTEKKPKQYLTLFGEHSLLTNTLKRFDSLIPTTHRFVVTIKKQVPLAEKEAGSLCVRLVQNEKVCCFEICEVNPTLDKENLMAENTFEILQRVVSQLV